MGQKVRDFGYHNFRYLKVALHMIRQLNDLFPMLRYPMSKHLNRIRSRVCCFKSVLVLCIPQTSHSTFQLLRKLFRVKILSQLNLLVFSTALDILFGEWRTTSVSRMKTISYKQSFKYSLIFKKDPIDTETFNFFLSALYLMRWKQCIFIFLKKPSFVAQRSTSSGLEDEFSKSSQHGLLHAVHILLAGVNHNTLYGHACGFPKENLQQNAFKSLNKKGNNSNVFSDHFLYVFVSTAECRGALPCNCLLTSFDQIS